MENFLESGLKPEILRAIDDMGFTKPTPVQVETLALLEEDASDLVALAQTGTGKTAGFGLPLVHHVDTSSKFTQALILCPTRELCLQITKDIQDYAKYIDNLFITPVYGGAPISTQARFLNKGSQVVVGTPGRVVDMIKRGILKLENIEWFVLDEADEMLNMGFKDDLESIFKEMPKEKSTWLFSATMPPKVESIARKYMGVAKRISIGKRNEGAKNVTHEYYMVKASDRYEALKRLADAHPEFYGVVFCRTRRETNELASKLSRHGYPAQALNGDLSQAQRDSVMRNFRSKSLRMLVATDVAARGIDVDDLTHVINYTLPDDPEVYVHRSGRTGRAGKSGICLSILHSRENRRLREIEKMVGKKFELKKVPTMDEIVRGRVLGVGEDIHYANTEHKDFDNLVAEMNVLLAEMDRDQLISQLTRYALKSIEVETEKGGDINASPSSRGNDRDDRGGRRERSGRRDRDRDDRRDRGDRYERSDRGSRDSYRDRPERSSRRDSGGKTESGFTTLEINVGSSQELKPNRLMGVINEVMGNDKVNFGRISIDAERSTVDVEQKYATEVAMSLSGMNFSGRQVDVIVTDQHVQSSYEDKPFKEKKSFGSKGGGKFKGKKKGSGYPKKGGGYPKKGSGYPKRGRS
ncbi:DEAD/DEAH box helicase [Cryomorphaceae bacterium 1068]|nr:DEAD/DEAH box helicase [Cryomorphaceae bacterium 1068]